MLEKITLQGFGISQILSLVTTGINIVYSAFGQGSPSSPGDFPDYHAPIEEIPETKEPLTEDQINKGNQIMLGLAGAAGIALVGIWMLTGKKRQHAV